MTHDARTALLLTALVCVVVVVALVRKWAPAAVVAFTATISLLLLGIITPEAALAGFASPALATVAALFVVARAVERTGLLRPLVAAALRQPESPRLNLLRLLAPSAAVSALINNSPIVAMLIGPVRAAAARTGWSASSVLMPLSFAVTLGGMTTLVGTSTNLVVSGFLVESGQRPLGIFELSRIGVPVAVLGVLTLVLLSPRLLSTRRSPTELFSEEGREYAVEMEVRERGNLVGSSVADAGLRHLQGVFLAWVQRAGRVVAPVEPAFVLQAGDHLGFVGSVQHVVDLQAMSGLRGAALTHARGLEDRDHRFVEVVVASVSPLVGQTLRNQAFREQYRAAVLAIHRAGARLEGKLGDIPLRSGDTLLLIAERGFAARWRDRRDFLLVSERDGALSIPSAKGWFVLCVTVAMMLAAALDWLPILHGALAAATLMVLTGIITPHEARNAVDLDVLLLIAASFGLGAAIETSGLATQIAGWLVVPTTPLGPIAVLAALVVATLVLTQVMANNAAAALMFPIATAAAEQSGANPRSFAIAIALAASAAFLTPIGYQTNTMILGPGGYRFSDYWKLGLPVTIVVGVGIVVSTGAG